MLKNAGIDFVVQSPKTDESIKKNEPARKMVERLSYEKAIAITQTISNNHFIVIAADTTVVSPKNEIIGKPANLSQAKMMLEKILGKTHHVLTAYTIIEVKNNKPIKKITRTIETLVKMRSLDSLSIRHYLSLGESLDKAGSYAAQGHGMNLIESISGSYTNVIGLPMSELIQDLRKKFKYPCPF
ncbi:MAG: septum formation protein Maf [Xanthomonadaceae bacterium]|nr:septum formation protein Maf [Xanthomonadaceae bacterium]